MMKFVFSSIDFLSGAKVRYIGFDKIPADENETIAFPLEDPFDIGYNPGKSMKINTLSYTAFTYCMKKELNNIISGEYFKHYKEE